MLTGSPPGTISNAPQRPGSSDRLSTADVIRRLRETRSRAVRTGLVGLLGRYKVRGDTWNQLHEIYQQLTSSKNIADEESAIFLRALSHDPRVLPMLWSAAASESDARPSVEAIEARLRALEPGLDVGFRLRRQLIRLRWRFARAPTL